MTEEVFIRTIRNRFFLRGVRRVVQLPSSQNWTLPSGYSFDLDTAANHSSEAWHATFEAVGFRVHVSFCEDKADFIGPYADLRVPPH